MFPESEAQKSPEAHIALHKKYLDVSPYILPKDERMARSTLWHWDLHAPNIFVKDDQITGLIDWQSAWAGPLFLQYRYPKLVRYPGDVMLRLPENYKTLDKTEQDRVATQVEKSLVQYFYEIETRKENPLLAAVNAIPHRPTRKQTVDFVENTWEDDILPFRQCLIRLERFVPYCVFSGDKLTKSIQTLGRIRFRRALSHPFYRGRYTEPYAGRRGME
jgi:hypothetical protein